MVNALEIDFLKVGDNSKSGDAITMRFGHFENQKWLSQTIFVVDGGDKAAGEAVISHVQSIYKTDYIDRVVLTHPDGDHASGLKEVVQNMKVGKIWMHRPWNHWQELLPYCRDGRITTNSFNERLRRAYDYADQIENIAQERKIPFYPPHQGPGWVQDNECLITILGPGKDYYLSLIQESDKTPRMLAESTAKTFSSEKVMKYEDMSLATENLPAESDSTSAENNMSIILYLTIAGKKVLLNSDAGCDALYKAIRYAKEHQINLRELDLMTIPHHGSRHNLSQGILSEIYAPIGVVSCAANAAPTHPSPIVINALLRRNTTSYLTQGQSLHYHTENLSRRDGYSAITAAEFTSYVNV